MTTSPKPETARHLLGSLKVENFRILQDFEVSKLGRVNLIVGKNNSGKSTVLEALRIYAGGANPLLLKQIAGDHNEKTWLGVDDVSELPYQNFFSGRYFPESENTEIYIGEIDPTKKRFITLTHKYFIEYKEEISDGDVSFRTRRKFLSKKDIQDNYVGHPKQGLVIQNNDSKVAGFIDLTPKALPSPGDYWGFDENFPSSYIPTQFVSVDDLAEIWDNILFSNYANVVKQGLKIIAEEFEDLGFVKSDSLQGAAPSSLKFRRMCKVKLENIDRAVPLNSLGDGMLRVLQLLLKIYPAKGGFLLIDEFENGLHYSIQEKVWRLLFDLAEQLDIQVFATTHSWDCIESFAEVAVEQTETEGVLFRVGRSIRTSDNGKIIATVFDKDKLFSITQADMEVR